MWAINLYIVLDSYADVSEKQIVVVYVDRSSHPEVFCKKGIHKNYTRLSEKDLCWSLFLIKFRARRSL